MRLFEEEPSDETKAEEKSRRSFWIAVAICGGVIFTFGQIVLRNDGARNIGYTLGFLVLPALISLPFKGNKKIIIFASVALIELVIHTVAHLYRRSL
jgi:hypothetical protein